ncbi:hypothetical protein MOV08_32950 [Streptomyces yunnanensis]|uniref:MgtC-like C-terminal domain-containing protein n=1 Tax=Streptomyces yunnanensis TaxID=156453 RepID=A0ABY8AF25_9ACTN|nr:hypothetical protein [Streptomyces yunnanensis]WEB43614.1 hypothetical protein MOV08_32950 [Streptomyces yunnanensis]
MAFVNALLLASVRQLIDRSPPSPTEPTVVATVHARCDPEAEPHIRARLSQALQAHGVGTGEPRVLAAGPDVVHLEAHFTTSGPITAPLGQLIADVWLNPAVHELHWHLDTVAPGRPTSRQPVQPTTPARRANRL